MAKILVIDDDSSLLQMISIILKRAGHEPLLATEGEEGFKMAKSQHPDLALVDVMMPMVNGYQVCYALRKDPATHNIPLLMLTALTEAEHRERAEDAGADGFVTKPISSTDLISQINELIKAGAHNFPEGT